ncbi:TonB-dependent receptor plug domain-containing protein, partial [candidate division KSB1 bacterium]|nr:TonB-dependent receptor plug domain-containing protein [candidate division KSB1 bacterium]
MQESPKFLIIRRFRDKPRMTSNEKIGPLIQSHFSTAAKNFCIQKAGCNAATQSPHSIIQEQIMQFKKIYIFISFILTVVQVSPSIPQDSKKNCGALYGRVFDQETGDPIAGITVFLPEITRSGFTHEDGHFFIPALPIGVYALQTFRIGYQNVLLNVKIDRCDTNYVEFRMKSSPLNMESVVVTSQGDKTMDVLTEPPVQVEGKKLRQQLGKTIAETISDEPGLDLRSMGPAPARPILRGLGGDRLLILEDGGRTGDLSATSADHAVVVEPITAERIEVIRGPEALMFGSNTLAGVINVGRGYIPTTNWGHLHATVTYQGETVNNGSSGGASVSMPLGPFALRMDGSFRSAGDMKTPIGTLDNTSINTQNGSVGLSLVKSWGFVGIAGSYYQSDYGIPGGFVGAHPYGVDIDLERKHLEAKSQIFFRNPVLKQLEINGSYSRYHHEEFESSGILGIEFGLLSYNFSLITRFKPFGIFRNGAAGIWAEYRDHAAGGLAFT